MGLCLFIFTSFLFDITFSMKYFWWNTFLSRQILSQIRPTRIVSHKKVSAVSGPVIQIKNRPHHPQTRRYFCRQQFLPSHSEKCWLMVKSADSFQLFYSLFCAEKKFVLNVQLILKWIHNVDCDLQKIIILETKNIFYESFKTVVTDNCLTAIILRETYIATCFPRGPVKLFCPKEASPTKKYTSWNLIAIIITVNNVLSPL